jgi:hypothetical protein
MCLCGKADLDNPLHRCLWIRMAYQRALNDTVHVGGAAIGTSRDASRQAS